METQRAEDERDVTFTRERSDRDKALADKLSQKEVLLERVKEQVRINSWNSFQCNHRLCFMITFEFEVGSTGGRRKSKEMRVGGAEDFLFHRRTRI